MNRFDAFKELTLLYFASASFSEATRRLGKSSQDFLFCRHPVFAPQLRELCESPSENLNERVHRAIEPIDVAGLTDRSRHPWYPALASDLFDNAHKLGATEAQLVQSLIDTSWRMNRATAVETNLFSLGITEMEDRVRANHPDAEAALAMALTFRDNVHAFSNISIYAQRLSRQFERTLNQLRQIQSERRAAEERQLGEAAKILKMHKSESLPSFAAPYNPAEDGFVFSTDQIETFLRRQNRREEANSHDFYSCA